MSKILKTTELHPQINLANFFQVNPNTVWGERIIYDFEFVLIIEGELSYIRRDEKTIFLQEGDILCIYPGVSHILKHERTNVLTSISCIHFEMLKNNSWLESDYKLKELPFIHSNMLHDYEIRNLFRKCCNIFEGFDTYREELLELTLKEIYLRIISANKKNKLNTISFRVQKMIHYIQKNSNRNISRKTLAKEFSLSPEYINAIFKNDTGLSPTNFIHRVKINKAYNLLNQEDLSVKEVADKLGFYDQFYFSKIFKRIMGFPPSKVARHR